MDGQFGTHTVLVTHIEIEPVARRLLEQGSLLGEVYRVHQRQDMAMVVWTWMMDRCRRTCVGWPVAAAIESVAVAVPP